MKKVFFILFTMVFSSCGQYIYQVCQTAYSDNLKQNDDCIVFENDDCLVGYNFWSQYGKINFYIQNKTDSVLKINLEESFYISNGLSHSYYKSRTWSKSNSLSIGITNYETNTLFVNSKGVIVGNESTSASVSRITSNGVSYKEAPCVSIAPHAHYNFYEFDILNSRYVYCDLKEHFNWQEDISTLNFNKENSPLRFSNYITYQVGSKAKSNIQNDFYIEQISNFLPSKYTKYENKNECGKIVGSQQIITFPIKNFSNSFYVRFFK